MDENSSVSLLRVVVILERNCQKFSKYLWYPEGVKALNGAYFKNRVFCSMILYYPYMWRRIYKCEHYLIFITT